MINKEIFIQVIIIGLLFVAGYMYLVNKDTIDLKCVISTVDGNKYCVRDRKEVERAANLLAGVVEKCKSLVKGLFKKYPNKDNVLRVCDVPNLDLLNKAL